MLHFLKVQSEDKELIQLIYLSYCKSFIYEERRDESDFYQLFEDKIATIYSITHHDEKIGYMITWHLSNCIFIEHFEVFPMFRNRQFGAKILDAMISKYENVVLECEPATLSEIAKRRVDFYRRNGFSVVDIEYFQPSYHSNGEPIPLWLLSTGENEPILDKLKKEIYSTVYHSKLLSSF